MRCASFLFLCHCEEQLVFFYNIGDEAILLKDCRAPFGRSQ